MLRNNLRIHYCGNGVAPYGANNTLIKCSFLVIEGLFVLGCSPSVVEN